MSISIDERDKWESQNCEPQIGESRGWLTRERILVVVLAVVTALALLLCYLFIQPFISVIAWALALAIVARPLHGFLAERIAHRDVAAGLAVALVAVLLITPAVFVLSNLIAEASTGAELVRAEAEKGEIVENVENTAGVGDLLQWARENVDLENAARDVAAAVTRNAPSVLAGSIWAVVQLLLVLFTLFFLFRDRDEALRASRSLVPLSNSEADQVFQRVADTVHATVYGSLLCALIQGIMGGLIFWLLGLASPVVWGVIMALLAVVPNLGTFVVWAPAAVYMALSGDWGRAAVLCVWGACAIGMIDNLLYPYLVGHRLRLHTLAVFFSMLGGLYALGAAGVILGPVTVALTLALVDIWRRRTAHGQPAEKASRPVATASDIVRG